MTVRGIIASAAACLTLVCATAPSEAWAVKYAFSGTIDTVSSDQFVPVGTTFTGYVDWRVEPYEGYYLPDIGYVFHYNVTEFQVKVGDYTQYIKWGPTVESGRVNLWNAVPGYSTSDELNFHSLNRLFMRIDGPTPDLEPNYFGIRLIDDTGTAFDQPVVPHIIDLASFTSARMTFSFGNAGGLPGGSASGEITTFQAIPEPSTWTMMLAGFGAIGGLLRQQRKGAHLALKT